MKKAVFFSAMAALAGAAAPAFAQETGRVISSTPVVQQVAVPQQNCGPQVVRQPSSGGGAVLGAIIGGVLGNGIGHGAGRALATGAGIFGGAAIGDRLENGSPAYAQNCATQTSYENRTVGYNVVYEYAGRQYTTQLPYNAAPGQTINLQGAAPVTGNVAANGVVTAPPMNGDPVQPLAAAPAATYPVQTVAAPQVVYAAPAYPVVYAPAYYRPAYYPPISFSIGYVGGWGGGGHHHHHWR